MVEGESPNQNEFFNTMNEEYARLCGSMGIISEFVRFHPVINNVTKVGSYYETITLGRTITMNLINHDDLWATMSGKNRNVIRKAQNNKVEIFHGLSQELLDEFRTMYDKTMTYDKADQYYYFDKEFYTSILNDLENNALVFYASYKKEIIAMTIIIYANNQMHYHLSASSMEYRDLAPTNLLLFEAALWGINKGFKTFHLGGGLGSSEDNLFRFKKAFNKGSQTRFYIGRRIFDQDKYNELVNMRFGTGGIISDSGYFPAYRT